MMSEICKNGMAYVYLDIVDCIRANVTNLDTYWVPLEEITTVLSLKKYLSDNNPELKIDSMNVIYKKIAIGNSKVISDELEAGEMVDIMIELSDGRGQEYVVHDKQMQLDFMYLVYSASKKSQG